MECLDDQGGGRGDQRRVPLVVLGNVVASRRRPVGTLDEEAELGLLFGREEDVKRRFPDAGNAFNLVPQTGLQLEADLNRHRPGAARYRNRPFKEEPSFAFFLAAALADDCDEPSMLAGDFLPEINALSPIGEDILDFLDLAQKQQRPRRQAAKPCGDFAACGFGWHLGRIETQHEQCRPSRPGGPGGRCARADVMLNAEMLVARMHFGHGGVGIDCLEPDAELADLRQVIGLGALADAANSPDVAIVENLAVMLKLEPVLVEAKKNP